MLLFGTFAEALEITGLSATLAGDNSADTSGTSPKQERRSSVGVLSSTLGPVADILGSAVTFDVRYASLLAIDRETGGTPNSIDQVSHYVVVFTINDPLNLGYSLAIETDRRGALSQFNDGSGSSAATLAAVVGTLNSTTEAGLGLIAATVSGNTTANTDVNQSNSHTANFVGTQTFTLDFLWTLNTTQSNQDEAAIRLGIGGSLAGTSVDDYPGGDNRTASNDGHFLNVTATLLSSPKPPEDTTPPAAVGVPEPGVMLLLGSGFVALGGMLKRRRP